MAGSIPDSSSFHWNTPDSILQPTREVLGSIDLDPCSNHGSRVNAQTNFIWPEQDGLLESWAPYKTAYVNPPYGKVHVNTDTKELLLPKEFKDRKDSGADVSAFQSRDITDWHLKCQEFAENGGTAIEVIPAAVNSIKGWHSIIFPSPAMGAFCFFRGRPHFVIDGRESSTGTQEIAAVLWTKDKNMVQSFKKAFSKVGYVVRRI